MRKAASDSASVDDLAPAHQAHLAHVDEAVGHVSFRHLLVRAAIVHRASLSERGSAHHSPAPALTESPEPRVWHLVESATGPDRTGPDGAVARELDEAALPAWRRGASSGAGARAADETAVIDRRRVAASAAVAGRIRAGDSARIRAGDPADWSRPPTSRASPVTSKCHACWPITDRTPTRRPGWSSPPPPTSSPTTRAMSMPPTGFWSGRSTPIPTPPRTTTGTTAASCSAAARQPLHPQSRAVAVSRHRDGPVRTGSSDPVQAVPPCASGPCGGWRRRLGRLRLARPSTRAAVTAVLCTSGEVCPVSPAMRSPHAGRPGPSGCTRRGRPWRRGRPRTIRRTPV